MANESDDGCVYRYKMINLSAVIGSYPKPYTNVLEKPCTQLPETPVLNFRKSYYIILYLYSTYYYSNLTLARIEIENLGLGSEDRAIKGLVRWGAVRVAGNDEYC